MYLTRLVLHRCIVQANINVHCCLWLREMNSDKSGTDLQGYCEKIDKIQMTVAVSIVLSCCHPCRLLCIV